MQNTFDDVFHFGVFRSFDAETDFENVAVIVTPIGEEKLPLRSVVGQSG